MSKRDAKYCEAEDASLEVVEEEDDDGDDEGDDTEEEDPFPFTILIFTFMP